MALCRPVRAVRRPRGGGGVDRRHPLSTDYQQAREGLGLRLRELRLTAPDGRLTGAQLAERLGWPPSKVSKLELGKQTATPDDLRRYTDAVGQPEAYGEVL